MSSPSKAKERKTQASSPVFERTLFVRSGSGESASTEETESKLRRPRSVRRWVFCGLTGLLAISQLGLLMHARHSSHKGVRSAFNDPDVADLVRWVWHDDEGGHAESAAAMAAAQARNSGSFARAIARGVGPRRHQKASAARRAAGRQGHERHAPQRVLFYSCIGTDAQTPTLAHFVRHYLALGLPRERVVIVLHASHREHAPEHEPSRNASERRRGLGGLGGLASDGLTAQLHQSDVDLDLDQSDPQLHQSELRSWFASRTTGAGEGDEAGGGRAATRSLSLWSSPPPSPPSSGYEAAVAVLRSFGLPGHVAWFGTFSAQNQGRVRRAIFEGEPPDVYTPECTHPSH